MKTDSEDYVLCVNDANVRIKEKSILKDISLTASSGNIWLYLGLQVHYFNCPCIYSPASQSENLDPILDQASDVC